MGCESVEFWNNCVEVPVNKQFDAEFVEQSM
jgi:hypothetical protein